MEEEAIEVREFADRDGNLEAVWEDIFFWE